MSVILDEPLVQNVLVIVAAGRGVVAVDTLWDLLRETGRLISVSHPELDLPPKAVAAALAMLATDTELVPFTVVVDVPSGRPN